MMNAIYRLLARMFGGGRATDWFFCARVFNENNSLDYRTDPYPTREEAIKAIRRKRGGQYTRCMTSRVRWNPDLRAVVPTHDEVQWHNL